MNANISISTSQIEQILNSAGVSVTPVRILVYKSLLLASHPLSLADIEENLESVDKSSVSRTLTKFRDRHLIHIIDDGSGSVKYEACHSSHIDNYSDFHVHFRCEICGETKCLHDVKIPEVSLPEGYIPSRLNYVISGICAECNAK